MARMPWVAAATFAALVSARAEARVTRIVITSQQIVAAGASFGDRGAYEKLTGTVFFEADPATPTTRSSSTGDYVSQVAASARALQAQRLMLQEDVDAYIAEAMASPVP
jgi:hypothetical protein